MRRRCSFLLTVVVLLLLAAPTGAPAFSKAIWGDVFRNGVNQFPTYGQLGASIYEASLSWNEIAQRRPQNPTDPRDPAYNWPASIQQAVTQAHRFHMRVLLQLVGTPGWANGHRRWNWAPKRPADYAAFASAAARRYPSVHLWMIWGEPNRKPNFLPDPGAKPGTRLDRAQQVAPHTYARMLDAAYASLKRGSAHNLVVGGCTYTTGDIDTQQWIQNLRLPNGRPPRMDMYAHNPFSFTDPTFSAPPSPFGEVQFSDLPMLARWIDHDLGRGLPIFLSEWTIPTTPDQEFSFYVDPPVAAKWITDAMRLSRRWHRIYALGWIHMYDAPPYSYGGLLKADATRKPGFGAFAGG